MSSSEEVEVSKKMQQKENSGKSDKKRSKPLRRATTNGDSSSDEGVEDKIPVKKAKTVSGEPGQIRNKDGEQMFELGSMRYVTVREFRGKPLVDIREFYIDKASGEMRPGKKGISLSKEQYQNFKGIMEKIDAKL